MRRWALRILVFLLLGAVVNVAVAWGCGARAQFGERASVSGMRAIEDRDAFNFLAFRSFGSEQVVIDHAWKAAAPVERSDDTLLEMLHAAEFKISMMEAYEPNRSEALPSWAMLGNPQVDRSSAIVREPWTLQHEFTLHDARGWPLKSLVSNWQCSAHTRWDWRPISRLESLLDGDRRDWMMWAYNRPMLPLRPLWPGFAINTVFYALVLWLLFAAPFALRRRRRIKRGLCPKCAYDLRGIAGMVCPECGTDIARFSR